MKILKEGCEEDKIREEAELTPEEKQLQRRIARYRKIANLKEDVDITEDNLDEWVLRHTCNLEGWNYDQARKEILGQKWTGYEK